MKKFLKSTELDLVNGGYLSVKADKAPITNSEFVAAQKRAEYVITFAAHAKNKTFVSGKVDSLSKMIAEVNAELATKATAYVKKPAKVVKKLADQLADEAMSFMRFETDTTKVEKMNNFLQEFNTIHEFEEFGLFFEDGIVKLNKIYTMKELVKAVEQTIDILA